MLLILYDRDAHYIYVEKNRGSVPHINKTVTYMSLKV